MTTEIAINKVVITAEAEADYASLLGTPFPKKDIKNETEDYISGLQYRFGNYFRVKYFDELADQMLLLFFYKGIRFGMMQMWELRGICFADDWTEELEEFGQVRVWLNSKLDPVDDGDWVWDLRVSAEKRQKERMDYNDEQ